MAGLILTLVAADPVHASVVFTGEVEPANSADWGSYQMCYIGKTSGNSGCINVTNWSSLSSGACYLGYGPDSIGTGTLSGHWASWTIRQGLHVAYQGEGTIKIKNGAKVGARYALVGMNSESTGTITVSGTGSTFTLTSPDSLSTLTLGTGGKAVLTIEDGGTVISERSYVSGIGAEVLVTGETSRWSNSGELSVYSSAALTVRDGGIVETGSLAGSPENLFGNGTIIARSGAVLDADLRIDAEHGITQILEFGDGGTLTFTMDGGTIGAGHSANGSLIVTDGIHLVGSTGVIGQVSGSNGAATIAGPKSKWISSESLLVGSGGKGDLTVKDGAEVCSASGYVGNGGTADGLVTIVGPGSKWTNSSRLIIGGAGRGTLAVVAGGEISGPCALLGDSQCGAGAVLVSGSGSTWTSVESLGVGWRGIGSFAVTDSGTASTHELSVNDRSLLAVDIGYGSQVTVDDGTGSLENNGTIRLLAGPVPAAGSQHFPIAAGTWTGDGVYQPLGGTWDKTTHVFTVSETLSGLSGQTLTIDLSDCQRALVEDEATGRTAGVSFLAKTGPGNAFDLTATALTPADIIAFDDPTCPQGLLLGGWDLAAVGSGYDPEDPVYVSLEIPSNLDRNGFSIWHHDGTAWTNLDPFDLTCAGGYASFTTEGLGVFAVTVPEPSALLLIALGILSISGLGARTRRRLKHHDKPLA